MVGILSKHPREGHNPPKRQMCATEDCGRPAVIRFERGGIGSHYCAICYAKIVFQEGEQ